MTRGKEKEQRGKDAAKKDRKIVKAIKDVKPARDPKDDDKDKGKK
jgi:hypothetical protein